MKLATLSIVAALAATPAFAQSAADQDKIAPDASSSTTVTPPAENPNVDSQTAAADTARQDLYKHKLDAAKAQSKADSAIADRDAAQAQANQDRENRDAAQSENKYPQ